MFLNKQDAPAWKEIITYNANIDLLDKLDACRVDMNLHSKQRVCYQISLK